MWIHHNKMTLLKEKNRDILDVTQTTSCLQSCTTSRPYQIWLVHRCLGHSSFFVLKSMFPSLFFEESEESFKCDVCQLAKHHHATYPPSNTNPFDLVHYDVWGPASNSRIFGAKWFVTFIMIVPMLHGFSL